MRIYDKHLHEQHNDLTIIATSTMPSKGYIPYYWCRCACGNIKRYRYDQIRKKDNCGQCEDFRKSEVLKRV